MSQNNSLTFFLNFEINKEFFFIDKAFELLPFYFWRTDDKVKPIAEMLLKVLLNVIDDENFEKGFFAIEYLTKLLQYADEDMLQKIVSLSVISGLTLETNYWFDENKDDIAIFYSELIEKLIKEYPKMMNYIDMGNVFSFFRSCLQPKFIED